MLLAIETSASHLGLGIYRYRPGAARVRPLAESFVRRPLQQSEALFPTLTAMFRRLRKSPSVLDAVAVNVGPGSFTGVRVGVSSARAIAQGLNLPLVGISGLEALAMKNRMATKRVILLPLTYRRRMQSIRKNQL